MGNQNMGSSSIVLWGLLGMGLASPWALAHARGTDGPQHPSTDAPEMVAHAAQDHLDASLVTAKGQGAPSFPVEPTPGDRRSNKWTQCDDGGSPCTRYSRTDRYQRTDAPIEGDDPDAGHGPYDWIAIDWGSRGCATLVICRDVEFPKLP